MKSPLDAQKLAQGLTPLLPDMFRAEDAVGTVHYSRFTVLSEKTLLFLGDFDGEFGQLMLELGKQAGPVFDAIFKHVSGPPPTPVANNAEAFVEWTADHLLHPAFVYTAYSGATARQIKALAAAADVEGGQRAKCLPRDLACKIAAGVRGNAHDREHDGDGQAKIRRDLDKVGTPHFVQFVPLEDRQMGFFTVYDGSFDKYIDDFTRNIGEVFDLLFKFTKGSPPAPCRKHV